MPRTTRGSSSRDRESSRGERVSHPTPLAARPERLWKCPEPVTRARVASTANAKPDEEAERDRTPRLATDELATGELAMNQRRRVPNHGGGTHDVRATGGRPARVGPATGRAEPDASAHSTVAAHPAADAAVRAAEAPATMALAAGCGARRVAARPVHLGSGPPGQQCAGTDTDDHLRHHDHDLADSAAGHYDSVAASDDSTGDTLADHRADDSDADGVLTASCGAE